MILAIRIQSGLAKVIILTPYTYYNNTCKKQQLECTHESIFGNYTYIYNPTYMTKQHLTKAHPLLSLSTQHNTQL
jgi:hypothetical protein